MVGIVVQKDDLMRAHKPVISWTVSLTSSQTVQLLFRRSSYLYGCIAFRRHAFHPALIFPALKNQSICACKSGLQIFHNQLDIFKWFLSKV